MATFSRFIRAKDRTLAPKRDRPRLALGSPEGGGTHKWAAKLPGDEKALRGIPAIGRGVAGAIQGSNPERAACRRPPFEAQSREVA